MLKDDEKKKQTPISIIDEIEVLIDESKEIPVKTKDGDYIVTVQGLTLLSIGELVKGLRGSVVEGLSFILKKRKENPSLNLSDSLMDILGTLVSLVESVPEVLARVLAKTCKCYPQGKTEDEYETSEEWFESLSGSTNLTLFAYCVKLTKFDLIKQVFTMLAEDIKSVVSLFLPQAQPQEPKKKEEESPELSTVS